MRRLPPAASPLTFAAIARAARTTLEGTDPAPRMAATLMREFGARAVVLLDSGTSALQVALAAAMERRPGLPVLLPAYACFDLVTAAKGAGARVRWYDVVPDSLQPDAAAIRTALAEGAAAVVITHLFGVPVDPAPWRDALLTSGAWLIDDAAQGVGARLGAVPCGALGDLGVLSFGRGKGRTGGGGGAVLAFSDEAAHSLARHVPHLPSGTGLLGLAKAGAQWALGRPSLYAIPLAMPGLGLGETRYRPPAPVRPMARAAVALLEATSAMSLAAVDARRRIAATYAAMVPTVSRVTPVPAAEPGALRHPVVATDAIERRRWVREASTTGLTAGYPTPLPVVASTAGVPHTPVATPGAERLAACLATLPTHAFVMAADIERIGRVIRGEAS